MNSRSNTHVRWLIFRIAILMCLTLIVSACGRIELGIETSTTTPDLLFQITLEQTPQLPDTSAASNPQATPDGLPSVDLQPSTEMAGLWIAYIQDGEIWLLPGIEPARRLITDSQATQVRISPDGRRIAYLRQVDGQGRAEIWSMTTAQGAAQPILSLPELDELHKLEDGVQGLQLEEIAFLPNSHSLIFTTFLRTDSGQHLPSSDLITLDLDSGQTTVILPPGDREGVAFAPSPDGRRVAFFNSSGLGTVNSDGSHIRPARIETLTPWINPAEVPLTWTENSMAVAVVLPFGEQAASPQDAAVAQIWLTPATDDPPTELTVLDLGVFENQYPILSPDLSRLAYFIPQPTLGEQANSLQIYSLSTENATLMLSDGDQKTWLGWSSDGRYFMTLGSPTGLPDDNSGGALYLGSNAASERIDSIRHARWIDRTHFIYHSRNDAILVDVEGQRQAIGLAGLEDWDATILEEHSLSGECLDRATLIADVTFGEGSFMAPGQPFTKIWRLRNDGTCIWSENYALVFDGGFLMGGPATASIEAEVEPGETVDVAVNLEAPENDGTYRSEWLLRNEHGQPFGTGQDASHSIHLQITIGPTPDPNLEASPQN